jgi:hypothetical protein
MSSAPPLEEKRTTERKGRVEQIIEKTASSLGNGIGAIAESGFLWIVFAVIWVGFGVALVASQGSLDAAWQWVRDLPWLVEGLVWVFFLPVMIGLLIWETSWALVLRLALVLSLAAWTLLVFPKPWK